MSKLSQFDQSVFINCPLDKDYEQILQGILFCLVSLGLRPRFATESSDAAEPRINKIYKLIRSCRYSIHDLSRCQASQEGEYYRLNMPFELGVDFGCRNFGGPPYENKVILILEEQRYRYQAAISDLAGSDIEYHEGKYQIAVRKVRNWFVGMEGFKNIGAGRILKDYEDFLKRYYEHQRSLGFSEQDSLDYPTSELLNAMVEWSISQIDRT